MTNSYLNQLLNEFDQEFESLIIPFPKSYVVKTVNEEAPQSDANTTEVVDDFDLTNELNTEFNIETDLIQQIDDQNDLTLLTNTAEEKLEQIKALATKISAERYNANYNPEISLANLLNYILSSEDQDMQNDFFQLLNQDNGSDLEQVLNDFDFYLNNPFKKKAEKMLSKIEARKNK